jgi:hypothetical protein
MNYKNLLIPTTREKESRFSFFKHYRDLPAHSLANSGELAGRQQQKKKMNQIAVERVWKKEPGGCAR